MRKKTEAGRVRRCLMRDYENIENFNQIGESFVSKSFAVWLAEVESVGEVEIRVARVPWGARLAGVRRIDGAGLGRGARAAGGGRRRSG